MLEGIRIVDFSFYLPGPFATMRLTNLGAEVIKIEPPAGDPARNMGVKKNGEGLVFLANNKNKKSMTLNLKKDRAQQIARDLIDTADVVVESFRPGVAKRLGMDYERVKEINDSIVYCSISGYGQHGDKSLLGSHDLNYMSLSGVLAQLKDSTGVPVHPKNTLADLMSSLGANEAILSGLIQSQRTGKGCYIDLNMTEMMSSFMANHRLFFEEKGLEHGVPFLGGEIVSYHIYETKDKRFISIAALEEKFWENFCNAVDREEWIKAHYFPAVEGNEVFEEIRSMFSSKTLQEWTDFGIKVDCCLTPVLETGEIASTCHANERKQMTGQHAAAKEAVFTASPRLGEHTEEILKKDLHISEKQIAEWRKDGVF